MKTRKRVIGKQFGPEPHQFDPYDAMTNKEFEAEVIAALDAAKQRQKAISIKLPEALLERTREEAKRRGVPYQTLIKVLLERSLDRLGAARWFPHSRRRRPWQRALVLGRPAADVTPDLERALLRSMARIKMVEEADAEGPLAELYAASKSRSVAKVVPDILRTMSLRPDFLTAIDAASRLHFSDGALTRAQHEMIASYVSALNKCRY